MENVKVVDHANESTEDCKACAAATVEQLEVGGPRGSYHVATPKQTDSPISYNIAPSQKVLAIRFNPETSAAFARGPAMGTNSALG